VSRKKIADFDKSAAALAVDMSDLRLDTVYNNPAQTPGPLQATAQT
jgi:hypothetical protein